MARRVLFTLITSVVFILGVAFSTSAATRLGVILAPEGETHKAITIDPRFPLQISLRIPNKQGIYRHTTGTLQRYILYVDGSGNMKTFPADQPIDLSYLGVGVYKIEIFPIYEYLDSETGKVLFKGIGFGQGPFICEKLEIPPVPKAPTGVRVLKGGE